MNVSASKILYESNRTKIVFIWGEKILPLCSQQLPTKLKKNKNYAL